MYFIKTPPLYLKKEIKFFYTIKANSNAEKDVVHRRLPDGTLDIVFNLSNTVHISKDEIHFEKMPDVSLTGLYTDRSLLKYEDKVHLVGAVICPGYAHLFVNDSLEYFKAGTVNASLRFGKNIDHLWEQMQNLPGEKEKHNLLEIFLMSYIKQQKDNNANDNISRAVETIHQSNGTVLVNDLCKKYFMSERNFRRKFNEYVGMAPKKYASIIRIKSLCKLYQQGCSYNKIINDLEYTDQAHICKEFEIIAGTSPSNFFAEVNKLSEQFLYFI